jgi:tetratricopeptide (TPR) repeat protein
MHLSWILLVRPSPQHRWGIAILAFLFVFSGCSTYQSVTGYFNTYYNSKKLFKEAVTESESTPQKARDTAYFAAYTISPGTKVKFDKIIEKSSRLIQFYEQSSWLDDAMFMIGVSYVYKDENESAIRKFKELEDNFPSSSFYLQAKLWHAKAHYFMKKDEEALKVTKDLLEEARKAGDDDIMLEMLMLEGQVLTTGLRSGGGTIPAVEVSGEDKLRAFSQYQVGLANERQAKYQEAAYAYGRVGKYSPEFNFGVRARLKHARMLTAAKEYELALNELDDLLEEKLTAEQISLTDLEIANTDWAKGDSVNAFALYGYIDSVYRNTDASAKANFQRGVIYETGPSSIRQLLRTTRRHVTSILNPK